MTETFDGQSRLTLVQEVAKVLRDRIYSGRYMPGQPLRQTELAEELRISRTPLREAFRLLEREGLVAADTTRGVNVIRPDRKRIMDSYHFREALDGLAAFRAAEIAAAKAEQVLGPVIERQRRATRPWSSEDYIQANVDFHLAIFTLSENDFLIQRSSIIPMTSRVFRPRELVALDRVPTAIAEHEAILESICSGDPERSEKAARAHIRHSISMLQASDWAIGNERI